MRPSRGSDRPRGLVGGKSLVGQHVADQTQLELGIGRADRILELSLKGEPLPPLGQHRGALDSECRRAPDGANLPPRSAGSAAVPKLRGARPSRGEPGSHFRPPRPAGPLWSRRRRSSRPHSTPALRVPDLRQRQLFRIRLGIAKPGRRRTGRLNERRDDARPGRRERIGRIPAEDPNLPGGRVDHPQKSRPHHGEIAGRARQPGRGRKHARGQESVAGPDQSAIEHLGPGCRPLGKWSDGAKPDPGVEAPCQPRSVRRGECGRRLQSPREHEAFGPAVELDSPCGRPPGDSRRTRAKRFRRQVAIDSHPRRRRIVSPTPEQWSAGGRDLVIRHSEEGGRLPR